MMSTSHRSVAIVSTFFYGYDVLQGFQKQKIGQVSQKVLGHKRKEKVPNSPITCYNSGMAALRTFYIESRAVLKPSSCFYVPICYIDYEKYVIMNLSSQTSCIPVVILQGASFN